MRNTDRFPRPRGRSAAAGVLRSLVALALLTLCGACQSENVGRWATVNGHAMYYEVRGAGPTIVLLHGGGDTIHGSFADQLGPFSAQHRVIAPEQVGHGHTPDVAGPLTYAGMMDDTAKLLESLHVTNADVVGFSDGAILALMLAAKHPELVRRVVASGANVTPDGLLPSEIEEMRDEAPADVPNDKDAGDEAAGPPADHAQEVEIGEKLRRLWLDQPTLDELSFDLLKTIRQPVLVMAGDHDVIRLDHTLAIYKAIPKARLWILPDTKHHTFAARPDWVNAEVLEFLAEW